MIAAGYLTQQEKRDTIPLYKEAFPEDGPGFLDYYYKEKARDNKILAAWEEEKNTRRIISMIQRNPYGLWIKGRIVDSDYIVAVATAKDKRHQGLMRMLLTRMIEDMHEEGMGFCYLMPADRKIYEPFDFVYIYDQEHWKITDEWEKKLIKQRVRPEDSGKAARWMESWLEEKYQVFAIRDQDYTDRLIAELESEKGWMEFLFDSDRIKGIRCWWGIHEREQRMLLCGKEYRRDEKEKTPAIMARITDVKNCLELICLKKNSPLNQIEAVLYIEDNLCPWNHGIFLWRIRKELSSIIKLEEGMEYKDESRKKQWDHLPSLYIGIGSLAQWIFGYRELEEVLQRRTGSFDEADSKGWWQHIDIWGKVFLDEVV